MNLTTTNFIDSLKLKKEKYDFVSLKKAQENLDFELSNLPFSYRILLENIIRKFDSTEIKFKDLENVINQKTGKEILFSRFKFRSAQNHEFDSYEGAKPWTILSKLT